jgi:3-oxoacyl-[acyl-carrier protein] reductase
MKKPLEGRVALITGASRGIGHAAALALSEVGAKVAVNYYASEEAALDLVKQITGCGGIAIAAKADVSQAAEVSRLVETVSRELGHVDVLVNNAGINPSKPLDQLTEDDWNQVIAINLSSAFLVSQAVLPGMREQRWGRIIMLSSVAAQMGGVIGPHYAASKAGMIGLAHSYAALLAKEGITANAIAPALIETDMIRGNDRIKPDLLPVGRFGQVSEVTDAIVLLATNGYISGQTLNINGGWYMS